MIRVVTIEREYGSGAAAIGRELGERLGFSVWDQGITEAVAKRLKCDVRMVEQREERPDPTYYRLVKTFMRGSYEDRTGTPGFEMLDAEGLSKLFEDVITEIADRGKCIIIGRAAPWFLRHRTDVCHVFLYASWEEKMRRTLQCGRTRAEAENLLQTVDQDRIAFVKKYHNMNWPTRELYHLMINTGVGDKAVVDVVEKQIEALNSAQTAAPGMAFARVTK